MIKCAIFDFDGTLVDSNNIKFNAFFQVTKNIPNSKKSLKQILQEPPGDRHAIFKSLSDLLYSEYQISVNDKKLSDAYTSICEEKVSSAQSIKGSEDSLEKLKLMGVKLFVSSATPEETLVNIINNRGISHFFDGIFGAPNTKEVHIQHVMKLFNLSSSEVVYIGDSEADRLAARMLNCHFVGIGDDYSRFLIKPSILLKSLHNLPKSLSLLES